MCGRGLRSIGVFLLLLSVLSLGSLSADEPEGMTDQEILDEMNSIINRQQERLTEAKALLTEQNKTLESLKQRLTESQESYMRLEKIIGELRTYSQNLEDEVRVLTRQRRALFLTLTGSVIAAVIGWLL